MGRSLLPLLRGTEKWRDAMLLEGWPGSFNLEMRKTRGKASEEEEDLSNTADARMAHRPQLEIPEDYEAIRTMDYIYIETKGDKPRALQLKDRSFSDAQSHRPAGICRPDKGAELSPAPRQTIADDLCNRRVLSVR